MRTKERETRSDNKPTAEAYSVMEWFIRDVRAGKSPNPKQVLRRHPQFEKSLRSSLEGMVLLDKEYRRFRKQCPSIDLELLFGIPGRSETMKP